MAPGMPSRADHGRSGRARFLKLIVLSLAPQIRRFMHLRALKLNGFKSFADPTELRFEPGVTAVVGPNGCGKSNIADAIRWVLGEQSAKALRGGKMQDVIFEGTDRRKPLQMCEVSLLLTDCEEQLGTDFNEIEITRRVSRDGGSDYFLNGRPCRLKDIQKLFMDTGVGRTSYSIMAQGQIDQILSSKPEERRAVFEEAAGITKYKTQRREALNKLKLVDQNLSRVTDVINEVSRQITSLRRQASKALRYKRLSHRLRHLDLAHNGHAHEILRSAINRLDEQLRARSGNVEQYRAGLESRESALAEARSRRGQLLQRVQEAQQAVFDLKSQKEAALNQAHMADIRRNSLEERIAQARDDLASIEKQLAELSEKADAGAQDKQAQLDILTQADAIFQERNRDLQAVEKQLREADERLRQFKHQLMQAESEMVRLRNTCSNLEVEQRTAQARRERLEEDFSEQDAAEAAAAEALEKATAEIRAAEEAEKAAEAAVAEAQEQVAQCTRDFRAMQGRIQELDRAVAQKSARLRLLQQLQERLEGFGAGARAMLKGRLGGAFSGRAFEALSASLKVNTEDARAVEALLGAAVEAVVVGDGETACAALSQISEQKLGRACLQFEAPPLRLGAAGAAGVALPEGIRPATSALAVSPEELEMHPAAGLLGASYIIDDVHAFLRFWRENPGFEFLFAASSRGELIDRRGLIYGGQEKKDAGILQRAAEMKQIAAEIESEQKQLAELRSEADALNARIAEAEKAVSARRREHVQATQRTASARTEEKSAARRLEETRARRARLERDRETVENTLREVAERLARATADLEGGEKKVQAARDAIAGVEGETAELRAERDRRMEAVAEARLDLAEKRQKVDALDRGLSEIELTRSSLRQRRGMLQSEIENWTEQIAELNERAASQRAAAEEAEKSLGVAQESVESLRSELAGIEEQLQTIEDELATLRQQSEGLRSEVSRIELELTEKRARLQFVREEVEREHQVDLSEINWRRELWLADQEPPGLKVLDLDEQVAATDAGSGGGEGAAMESTDDGREPPTADSQSGEEDDGASEEGGDEFAPEPAHREPTAEELAVYDEPDWNAIRTEVDALRKRLNSMGPVNLVAIEEYGELKQRFEFLKTQCDDLTRSKEELLEAIDEINRTSQTQFADTFEQIRKNFASTFNTLFGGGHADLRLQESEDVLESGIEIVAQPPGTRLRSITLLSGGQKTMTAVALLFAIYLVKPSPFCLLDELDAPLDESNIGRFTTLLKEFTRNSQFIIITHNKRTIAASQSIYGVTMEERGVSKVVSMRFHTEHDDPDMAQLKLAIPGAD
ncbi:MAG: chromosome segregation protein SMC [Verrucomicrobia bacterium]|nr:MAG: chromosome segregation protein SMC [Verrucomicrobiota bacterium]